MSIYFKLVDIVETPQTINVAEKRNGITSYGHVRMKPGEKYFMKEDELFQRSISNAEVKKRYSSSLEGLLKESGISYRIDYCKTCGGSVKHIYYNIIEVITVED